jgi:hypothetical protein
MRYCQIQNVELIISGAKTPERRRWIETGHGTCSQGYNYATLYSGQAKKIHKGQEVVHTSRCTGMPLHCLCTYSVTYSGYVVLNHAQAKRCTEMYQYTYMGRSVTTSWELTSLCIWEPEVKKAILTWLMISATLPCLQCSAANTSLLIQYRRECPW